jgi:hypothetical protein
VGGVPEVSIETCVTLLENPCGLDAIVDDEKAAGMKREFVSFCSTYTYTASKNFLADRMQKCFSTMKKNFAARNGPIFVSKVHDILAAAAKAE